MPDDVQGQAPQGGETSGAFESYLQTVPEDARETVASYLKDAERNVNGRLQEAAEFRKAWEPYQNVEALQQYPPEQLNELLAWHQQVTSDEDAFKNWLAEAAKEAGISPVQEQQLEQAEEDGELSKDQIEQLIQEQAEQRLAPLQERMETWEAERAVDHEEGQIRMELDRLQADSGIQLSDAQKAMVLDLGINDDRQDWVAAGFERFREITTEGQRAFVADKANQPGPTLGAGGQAAFKPTTDWAEATAQARERLRQAMQS